MNPKYIKILGLIGALFAGGAIALSGDLVTAAGIVSAALSSAGVLKQS